MAIKLTLNDTEWHEIENALTTQFTLRAITNSAIEMAVTDETSVADSSTKAYVYLGGIINDIVTKENKRNWIRAITAPADYIINETSEEEFDETSALRTAIATLQLNMLKLSNRVLTIENWKAYAIRDWNILKYELNHRIDHLYHTLARLIKTDVLIIKDLHDLRQRYLDHHSRIAIIELMYATKAYVKDNIDTYMDNHIDFLDKAVARITKFDAIFIGQLTELRKKYATTLDRVSALEYRKADKTSINEQINDIKKVLTEHTNIDDTTINRLLSLETQYVTMQENINTLSQSTDTVITSQITQLQSQLTEVNNELDTYWELCIAIGTLSTVDQINQVYNEFLTTHDVSTDMLAILSYAKNQAIATIS